MTTTINASPSNGIVQTADGSGLMKLQSNGVTTNALAWVNFNGVTTATIRASYNVSSVTRNGTGDYTINFAAALSDANYSAVGSASPAYGSANTIGTQLFTDASVNEVAPTTSTMRIKTANTSGTAIDVKYACVAIFGN
jgi:hypothetical protein